MGRRLLFQLHWLVGITAGIVLAVVGTTGAMLSFEDELLLWMNRGVMKIEPTDGPRLAPAQLLARLGEAYPGKRVASLTLYSDPERSARVIFD
ncbi:MAG TPA: PepSY domain-containing protein, partial [Rhodothermales bacterium]